MRALEAAKGIVVVDSRENAAAEAVRQALPDGGSILVLALNNRYPAAARRYLRRDALGKGQAPGTFILDTAAAVAAGVAVSRGLPYIEKVVTLAGSGVKEPKNLRVRLGTRFSDVLAAGGEFDGVVGQVIAGGPLTGNLVGSLAVPVTKAVDGIIAIAKADVRAEAAGKCIRCGYCVSACPVGLLPLSLGDLVEAKRVPETLGYHLADCIECGVCAYECPAKRPLLHYIQLAKAELAK